MTLQFAERKRGVASCEEAGFPSSCFLPVIPPGGMEENTVFQSNPLNRPHV
ncbi:hypothetical protein HMPREF1326_03115 [Akkermansia sp. KLE1605]|nr:hypothetical protein HMPREF1326_03115 [Akkermansia sp. KLE1605]